MIIHTLLKTLGSDTRVKHLKRIADGKIIS